MCTVSVMSDWGQQHVQPQDWTRPAWNEYQEILKRLEALDEKLGLANCEDPEKALWMQKVEERLAALEGKV